MDRLIVTIPFRSWLPDSELELFFGKDNVIEIRRTKAGAVVEVDSDKPVEVLADLLMEREDNWHLQIRLQTDKSWANQYRKIREQLSAKGPCEPVTRRVGTAIEHGFEYIHEGNPQTVWFG